ncbi:MAG: HPF/RaiA family ribosome-associated protein [Myxococcales bacterium]|nr:HPF/RaiA family ribosome-associated protein [Myxococcales bacterium]MCB9736175.1 HPF/RaiA family ribosome-associated protein [Deltaproteobacteria bacterium]
MPTHLHIAHHDGQDTVTEEEVKENLARLEDQFGPFVSCRVSIDAPHKHSKNGAPVGVKLQIVAPHCEVNVSEDADTAHNALRDAFEAAKKQLRTKTDKQRSKH